MTRFMKESACDKPDMDHVTNPVDYRSENQTLLEHKGMEVSVSELCNEDFKDFK